MTQAKLTRHITTTGLQRFIAAAAMAVAVLVQAWALPLEHYAADSKLASGTWVKISVKDDGMYLLTESALRSMGFASPKDVKVYGYGGRRIPELLDATTYLDDLPQTPSEWIDGRGLVFYGQGVWWDEQSLGEYRRPVTNYFTTEGYYFLSDSGDTERLAPGETATAGATSPVRDFGATAWHKNELVSPGECGHLLLGEDFKYTTSQEFRIDLPGRTGVDSAYIETSFVANSATASNVSYTVNGKALNAVSTDRISGNSDSHTHGMESLSRRRVAGVDKDQVRIGVKHTPGGTIILANLNYISVVYRRALDMKTLSGATFRLSGKEREVSVANTPQDAVVWDVTEPLKVARVRTARNGDELSWTSDYNTERNYVAWSPTQTFLTPGVVGRVCAQNVHALPVTDMVIVTCPEWRTQAERLADFHRTPGLDSLSVTVITPEVIYNEFSSGVPDVMAFRKFFKMMYDRGTAEGRPLRYAIMMGRVTFDNRRLTYQIKNLGYSTLPAWFSDGGLSDNSAYTTDDIMAFLEDGSGRDKGRDRLSIALGRMPVTSPTNAKEAVDKVITYSTKSPRGNWRNNVLLLADDLDGGIHMKQIERQQQMMKQSDSGSDLFFKKIYVDQYDLISNVCVQGRSEFYRALDEGVMWWTYIGHASPTALTAEGIVTYGDLNGLYLRHFPVVYAATCNFLRWDSPTISGAELLFMNPNGGVSAAISATRPVYISDNGNLSDALGRNAFARGADGRLQTVGQIYTSMKNNFLVNGNPASNSNKLRYVLLGDPAMRLAMPSARVVLDSINGKPFVGPDAEEGEPTTLMARQQVKITGHIEDPTGGLFSGFNGVVTSTLYDAETSYTTQGHTDKDNPEPKPITYDQQGGRLFVGNDSISDGRFTINISMPAEVADNYRPAALNLFAYSDSGDEAVGVNRDFYVYGLDTDALPDDVPPTIDECYLNHPTFRDGGTVNPSPMLVARISDDRAINLSTAGIGHQMLLTLDEGAEQYTDVAQYYTPNSDGTPGGTLAYPLENLTSGEHTLRLRVWDTAPNSAEETLRFNVATDIAPTIYDVYTDTNPASVQANFYISHDRPDQSLDITIEVYDLMGRRVWQSSQTGRYDMFSSVPVVWNLTDNAGRRVGRGIYLYRATISDPASGDKTSTASRKLAVTAE